MPFARCGRIIARLILRCLSLERNIVERPGVGSNSSLSSATGFPGARFFQQGRDNIYVFWARLLFIEHGVDCFYQNVAVYGWSMIDVRSCAAFQHAHGWDISDRLGIMDAETWKMLTGDEEGAPCVSDPEAKPPLMHPAAAPPPDLPVMPAYPGPRAFGLGRKNMWILLLRLRLLDHGFAEGFTTPVMLEEMCDDCRWDDRIRASCTTFQLAQGWRGKAASGYPCELTWRLLWNDAA
ncbi:hypothetical protein ACIQU6_44715 [Streptomyces sp. NPDC090442]|uniref:hypothetical protein n=1 Tax=Streptomyces sp. NPDC090442 TaxID=3365962 RepID=UPI00381B61F6